MKLFLNTAQHMYTFDKTVLDSNISFSLKIIIFLVHIYLNYIFKYLKYIATKNCLKLPFAFLL